MLREDTSGRFDYLFEPLDVVESAGDGDSDTNEAAPPVPAQPDNQNRWSNRIVLAGVVLATMAAATATAIALLQPAQPAQPTVIPTDATPASSPASIAISTTAQPVPVSPATVSTTMEQQRPPVQRPTTTASKPAATMPPPPTTRAPISVSPASRAPFPNQSPPRNNDHPGGLLGGLL
jgi:cytoskeletal protein RodZ